MASISERRQRLCRLLAGTGCISPPGVYDPLSARLATDAGFEIAVLPGSLASFTLLAAPDLTLVTLTELADLVRRVTRASDLSVIVDADHGFGNALNVMRTIEELEHAGAAAVLLEDTELPARRAGQPPSALISLDEMVGKLRAALAARRDPSMVVVGRTAALTAGETAAAARVRAFEEVGVDAVMITHVRSISEIEAMSAVTTLPLLVGHVLTNLAPADVGAAGARVFFQGHPALAAMVKALGDAYTRLRQDASTDEIVAPAHTVEHLVRTDQYRAWQREFLPH